MRRPRKRATRRRTAARRRGGSLTSFCTSPFDGLLIHAFPRAVEGFNQLREGAFRKRFETLRGGVLQRPVEATEQFQTALGDAAVDAAAVGRRALAHHELLSFQTIDQARD